MKKVMINIIGCIDCPNLQYDRTCSKLNRLMDSNDIMKDVIPKDCPLEDSE